MQKDLNESKSAYESIRKMWLEGQKENLKIKTDMTQYKDDNIFLRV
jgi:hypothetical protein